MKTQLNVKEVNGKLVVFELSYQPVETELGEVKTVAELSQLAKSRGVTRANLTPESKALLSSFIDSEKAMRKQAFEEKKAKAAAKKAERIAKMKAQLAKLEASS